MQKNFSPCSPSRIKSWSCQRISRFVWFLRREYGSSGGAGWAQLTGWNPIKPINFFYKFQKEEVENERMEEEGKSSSILASFRTEKQKLAQKQ